MNKPQALAAFWDSFGWDAYDENTVPDDATLPYITYESATDSLGNAISLTASLWYRSSSWAEIEAKAAQIERAIAEHGFYNVAIDGGYLWIVKGTPFAQRMSDTDPGVRRIVLTITAEYLTAY